MPRHRKREVPMLSEAEEQALQAAIAADPDAAELTDAQLSALRPAREVLPAPLYDALVDRRSGNAAKVPVTFRLDPAVVEAFKAKGEDWQARMTRTLARAARRLRRAG